MQNGESGSGVNWGDKLKSFGKDMNDRRQEGGVITHATQAKDAMVDVGKQIGHGAGEEFTRVSGAVGVIGDRLGQAGEYIGETATNLSHSVRKDLSPGVVGAGLKKFGSDVLSRVQSGAEQVVMRNVGKVATIYNDRLAPALRNLGAAEVGNAKFYNAFNNESAKTIDSADESEVRASEKIEGGLLIEEVMGNLKAAVDFDQMKDVAVAALLEKALGGTELARKAGPVLLKGLVAMMLESSNFSGQTADAKKGLQALLANKEQMQELKAKQIDLSDLARDFNAALEDISSKRELVISSRGKDKNLSWEYEGGLIQASENAQSEVLDLGWEVVDSLPESAVDLDMDSLVAARIKSQDFSRKANEVIFPLRDVAKSMEKRFPEKVEEIRASLSKVLAKWTESKGVARQLMKEFVIDKSITNQVQTDIFDGIINKNEMFASLTNDQQQEVMAKIGGKTKDGAESGFDRVPGTLYDQALQASEEYARLSLCYEQVREYVNEHPEAADALMVLAENVMQAKSVMKLAQNKIDAEILVQSRKIKNNSEFTAQRQGNLASEAADRVKNKERYAMILDRYNERVQREAPTVKKIAKILGVTGIAVVVGKEVGPEVADALIEVARMIAKAVVDNIPMVTKAIAAGGGLWASVNILGWAREKMGKKAGRDAYKELSKAESDKKTALSNLESSFNQLKKLGQDEAANRVKQIMDDLKSGDS